MSNRIVPPPQLSEEQRDRELAEMSEDDHGHIVAFVADQYPGVFDEAFAALNSYRGSHLKVA